jgi:hypothetical protein
MEESKINITHRLQKDGRWDGASKFKDEFIAKSRSEGMNRAESRQAGWEAMEKKYPPLSNPLKTSQSDSPDPEFDMKLRDQCDSTFTAVHKDILWAYNNFEVSDVSPNEAPSRGAWGLMMWGRENRDKFFSQIFSRVIVNEKYIEEEKENEREEIVPMTQEDVIQSLIDLKASGSYLKKD